MRIKGIASLVTAGVLVVACGQAAASLPPASPSAPPPSAAAVASTPPSPSPTPQPTPDPTPAPSPSGTGAFALVASQLHGARQPILDVLDRLGYECGAEESSSAGPRIFCVLDGAVGGESAIVLGTGASFLGVGLVTPSLERMATFVEAFGTQDVAARFVERLKGMVELANEPETICPLPCTVSESGVDFGPVWTQLAVLEDGQYLVALTVSPT